MKKLIVLLVLCMVGGLLVAQEKVMSDFDLFKVSLSFTDLSKKKVRGILYSINDSVIVISDARNKRAYRVGDYNTTTYRLDQIEKIKTKRKNGSLVGFLIGFGVNGTIGFAKSYISEDESCLLTRGFSAAINGVGAGLLGGIIGAEVGRDRTSLVVGKTDHLVERFGRYAVVKDPELAQYSRFKIFSISPVEYQRNIQFEFGYKLRVAYEQPIYKGNSILLGVGYFPINDISREGKPIVNQYAIKTRQSTIDIDNLKLINDFKFGRIYDGSLGDFCGRASQSIYLSYDYFLPEYSIPITLDVRSYFGLKADNMIKPFCEIGVGLNAVKGYDFSVSNKLINHYDFKQKFVLEEKIVLGDYRFDWETKLDLALGMRYQKRKDFFWEIKRNINVKQSKWRRASITKDGVRVMGNTFGNWTAAVGHKF